MYANGSWCFYGPWYLFFTLYVIVISWCLAFNGTYGSWRISINR